MRKKANDSYNDSPTLMENFINILLFLRHSNFNFSFALPVWCFTCYRKNITRSRLEFTISYRWCASGRAIKCICFLYGDWGASISKKIKNVMRTIADLVDLVRTNEFCFSYLIEPPIPGQCVEFENNFWCTEWYFWIFFQLKIVIPSEKIGNNAYFIGL